MATQKRRVVYLSDEEWAKVGERSQAFGLSHSQYLGKLIEWRQPGPWYVKTGKRGLDPLERPSPHDMAEELSLEAEFGHLAPLDVRPFAEFRPAPKPGRK